MLESIKYYLNLLISDGHKWQYTNISGNESKPRGYFSSFQWVILLISILSLFALNTGFNKNFIGYIIASLSIFIGLFLTLIVTVFDKFQQLNFDKKHMSAYEEAFLIQRKNFFRQFTALTSYSILISLLCIVLLSASLLGNFFNQDILVYSLAEDINQKSILSFATIALIVIYRISVVYFLLDFLVIVVFVLSSIYNYMSLEYDRKKVRKDTY